MISPFQRVKDAILKLSGAESLITDRYIQLDDPF